MPRGVRPQDEFARIAGSNMQKLSLVSIVDDDQHFRDSLKRLMRSLGYRVEAFPSAADFLASPRLMETACLIADIHMPGMTGVELHRQLIHMGHSLPTILVTAYPKDIDRDRALNDGVVGYLRKPLDEQELIGYLGAIPPSADSSVPDP
jgi:FixJ family two-component response regulator